MNQNTQPKHSEFLQLMRFIAAGLVLVTHTTFYYRERSGQSLEVWHFGEIGVPIFFVISGIVMVLSSQTLPRDSSGASKFIRHRIIRIVPMYWLVTAIKVGATLMIPSAINHNHFDLAYATKSFFFIPTYNESGEVRPIHGVGWTLLHEMFFYILFSMALLLRCNPVLPVSIIIASLFLATPLLPSNVAAIDVITSPVNLYFVIGMLVGTSATKRWNPAPTTLALVCTCVLGFTSLLPISATVVGISILTLFCLELRIKGKTRYLLSLGDSSYSLYLFHPLISPLIVVVTAKVLHLPASLSIGLAIIGTIAGAHIVYVLVEKPATALLKRFLEPKPQSAIGRSSA